MVIKELDTDILEKISGSIKQLSIEAIQKAGSGHPGMPLGCAELAAYLFGFVLKHNPKNPKWINRDRFVLSAGHASALLYSCLHLAGYNVSMEDLQHFRQLHSKTPGHPEFGHTEGVEATTGPLGQGVGNAAGMALSMKIMAAKFNRPGFPIFTGKVYCLAGDGCFMEGINHEVCSWAGRIGLDNLVLIYDYNGIVLDGSMEEVSCEDVKARFQAYGWEVFEIDGYDFHGMKKVFDVAKHGVGKPILIIARTIIGHGSPKAGSNKAHGAPLGEDGVAETKRFWNLAEDKFFIPRAVEQFFSNKLQEDKKLEEEWTDTVRVWSKHFPELHKEFLSFVERGLPENLEQKLADVEAPEAVSGRVISNKILQVLSKEIPNLIGGSADLSSSDGTFLSNEDVIGIGGFLGKNIKYGVREFGMGAVMNGLASTKLFRPYGGTFLVFSDYLRNAIRLAALSKLPVIYQFTHDSILIGEDGPTHQPVEHIMSLRAIPGLRVFRAADANEAKVAWLSALKYEGPTALIWSRQNLPTLEETNRPFSEGASKGGYVLIKEKRTPDYTFFATGSEVHLAVEVAHELSRLGKSVRVVSMPCWEIFEEQDDSYKNSVVGGDLGKRVSIEAGSSLGWFKYIGTDGIALSVESFGLSGSPKQVAEEFGFTVHGVLEQLLV
ncbi:transketolase [Chlamydiifrater phoenicopteri]|uniref:transketolase n=1 Tax=Chlamydiifrater phoenicopteri TaxID=2681469 RepID=UPI001BCE0C74|nr:transketolase [Chlamydiifrater phoenicopteri]